jgi:hypothetical protein
MSLILIFQANLVPHLSVSIRWKSEVSAHAIGFFYTWKIKAWLPAMGGRGQNDFFDKKPKYNTKSQCVWKNQPLHFLRVLPVSPHGSCFSPSACAKFGNLIIPMGA